MLPSTLLSGGPRRHTLSGIVKPARYPRSSSRSKRLASLSPITCSVAGSKFSVRPSRHDTLARCTRVVDLCASSMGEWISSARRLRTQSMKLA